MKKYYAAFNAFNYAGGPAILFGDYESDNLSCAKKKIKELAERKSLPCDCILATVAYSNILYTSYRKADDQTTYDWTPWKKHSL